MTREIKFRAWDKAKVSVYRSDIDSRRMSYYGKDFIVDDNNNTLCFITPYGENTPFGDNNSMDRYELMQYTGLKDKNGKEIYEGDIVNMQYGQDFEVIYYKNGFYLNDGIYSRFDGDECCVIGNIYQNPELIK